MKIYRYKLSYPHMEREGLIIQLQENGYGEIAPLPGWSTETLEDALAQLQNPKAPLYPSVAFGLNSAKTHITPCTIPINGLDNHHGRTLKLKLKNLPLQEAIQKTKAHLPQYKGKLRLDINRAWTLQEAHTFLNHFQPSDFDYLEEPLQNFHELKYLAPFPIALDEHLRELPLEACFSPPSLKAFVIKPTLQSDYENIIIKAKQRGIECILSSSYESGIGTAYLAILAKTHNLKSDMGLSPYFLLKQDLLQKPHKLKNGHLITMPLAIKNGPLLENQINTTH